MTENSPSKRRYRVVFRRSRPLMKCAALAMVVLCIVTLFALRGSILATRQENESLRAQAGLLEEENSRLEEYIRELGTIQGIFRIAQEELGLADPNTTVFTPES